MLCTRANKKFVRAVVHCPVGKMGPQELKIRSNNRPQHLNDVTSLVHVPESRTRHERERNPMAHHNARCRTGMVMHNAEIAHSVASHECDHQSAVNRSGIRRKSRCHIIRSSTRGILSTIAAAYACGV